METPEEPPAGAAPADPDAEKLSGSSGPDSDDEAGASGQTEMEFLRNLFSRTLGLGSEKPEKVLDELTLEGVTRFMLTEKCKNIICMVGAGISTSAGIPDFRSPGTGLYANLQQYNLPYPEAIFEISYFKQNPEPFFTLARELYPGQFKPTICHYFMRLLKEKGLLLRCYTQESPKVSACAFLPLEVGVVFPFDLSAALSLEDLHPGLYLERFQNIDTLERVAGLDTENLVEAHGTFYTSHCVSSSCRKSYSLEWMKEKIFSSPVPKCEKCQSIVKPDIVLFGENLPSRFFSLMQSDFQKVDLLIIMGTSLQVQPFASLVSRVPTNTPRLLINKEKTGESDPLMSLMGFGCGMDFDSEKAYRDVAWIGDCDEGCLALAEMLGWKQELEELVRKEHAAIDGVAACSHPTKREERPRPPEKKKASGSKEE